MSNFNFFMWIRQGVSQAVLLGVSDAMEEIGMPASADGSTQSLPENFRRNAPAITAKEKSGTTKRRRLGRSLKEMDK